MPSLESKWQCTKTISNAYNGNIIQLICPQTEEIYKNIKSTINIMITPQTCIINADVIKITQKLGVKKLNKYFKVFIIYPLNPK